MTKIISIAGLPCCVKTIVYDTTNNFMDIRQIKNIYKKEDIENEARS